MSDSSQFHDEHERQLDAIIARYYRAVEEGLPPDQDKFAAQHPEFEKDLCEFFADLGHLQGAVPHAEENPALSDTVTMKAPQLAATRRPSVVRYFGEYEILGELGVGGMGVVYKARQTKLRRIVALKMIKAGELANPQDVQRFQAEAKAVAKLSHPGIVAVHEVGMHQGQYFYTMDFVGGGNLSKLHHDGPVSARRAAELVRQLAEAVHHAHGEGIVHRDLKPANVLLTEDGAPRITDFGLAKRMWVGEDSLEAPLTETGQILGTAGYMSPEQAAGKTRLVGPPADIYALGSILYALLTSRAPFVGESLADTILQLIHKEPVSPHVLNPSVARDLETICLKCLAKEPHKRYGTAQLLAEDLARFLDGRPVVARPISRAARTWRWCRRNPVVAMLSTAMLLTLILGTVISTTFGVIARDERDAAVTAKAKESDAKKQAQKDRDDANEARKYAQTQEREALSSLYVSRLYALAPLWQQGEWGELARLLEEWTPKQGEFDFRGWEWHYLNDQVQQHMRRLPGRVTHAVWSPDGKYLAAAGDALMLYDATTLKPAKQLGSGGGHFVAWSNDSSHLALLSDKTHIFDVASGKLVQTIESSGKAVSWAPDNARLAIVGQHNTETSNVKIWSKSGVLEQTIELGAGHHTHAVDWHPNDERVLVSHEAHFSIWDAKTGNQLAREWSLGHPAWTVEWSPNGNSFLVGGGWGNRLWKMENGKALHRNFVSSRGHSDHAAAGTWSADGRLFASGGSDFALFLYQADSLECCGEQHLHTSPIKRLSWHPDGRLVSCDAKGIALIYRPIAGDGQSISSGVDSAPRLTRPTDLAKVLPGSKGAYTHWSHNDDTQWSHNDDRVAAFCPDGAVRVWSATSYHLLATLSTGEPSAVDVRGKCSWSPDDRQIAVADTKGQLCVYSSAGSLPRLKRTGFSSARYQTPYWSDDGEWLVACRADENVVSINAQTGTESDRLPALTKLATAFSPDGRHYIRVPPGAPPRSLEIVDVLTKSKHSVAIAIGYRDVAWHPDGRTIGVATPNGIILIDVATGKETGIVEGGLTSFCSLAWSPDGRRLAAGTIAGQIDILDAQSHLRLITLKSPASADADYWGRTQTDKMLEYWITSLDWSHDSRRLASGGKHALIWGSDEMPRMTADIGSPAQPATEQTPIDIERVIANAVIQQQGEIDIGDQRFRDATQLPKSPFSIRTITLHSPRPLNTHLATYLWRLKNSWRLDVCDSGFENSQLNLLRQANALSELVACRCPLDDKAVALLAEFKQLKVLDVRDTLITKQGVAELRQKRPDVEVRWDAREADREVVQRLLAKNATATMMIGQQRLNVEPGWVPPPVPFRVIEIKAEEKAGLATADFDGIEKLDALESIDLLHTRLNDTVLEKLSGLTRLRVLGCGGTNMTGKPLANFKTMPNLHLIVFSHGLSNESVVHFDKFPKLKTAFIGWNEIDDTMLERLPALPELETLWCGPSKIQGTGFPALGRFTKLRSLDFSDTPVTDEGLCRLPLLSQLTELGLSNTSVTDASITHLSKFTTLKKLRLLNTSISPSALAELRNVLKGCVIEWSQAVPKALPVPEKVPTLSELTAAIEAQPEARELLMRRGRWYIARQQWPEALRDLEQYLKLRPDDSDWRGHAISMCLLLEDEESRQRHYQVLIKQLPTTTTENGQEFILRSLSLDPHASAESATLMKALTDLQRNDQQQNYHLQRLRAGVLYRSGKYPEAIAAAEEFLQDGPVKAINAEPWLFRIMALAQLKQTAQAEGDLKKLKTQIERQIPEVAGAIDWFVIDAMHARVLYREAAQLILNKSDDLKIAETAH